MKTLAIGLLLTFLIICSYALAQSNGTNRIGSAEAIKIVSQFPKGMRHAAVLKVLERKGLKGGPGGPVFHLTVFNSYDLADGCRLTLGYLVPPHRDDPRTENSPLSEAYITSNSVRINITLTNAP